jgi:hypothetical protein
MPVGNEPAALGRSLLRLARFAHAAGEIEISNILAQPFAPECPPEVEYLKWPPPRLSWRAPAEHACNELRIYANAGNQYLKLLEFLERIYFEIVGEAIATLVRSPSAEQAKTVVQLQETLQLLQEEMKVEREKAQA